MVARALRHAAGGLGWASMAGAIGLALAAGAAAAADIEFSASVDRTSVGLGEQIVLTLSVRGEDMSSVPSPELPALADFSVLGRSTSQSTNISLIGGQLKRQATVDFIYALQPNRIGKATIPACTITYQGKAYASQPIEIDVVKAVQGQAAPNAPPQGSAPSRAQVPIEGNLYLSVAPSRRSAYVGQPVTVEISLWTRYQISDAGWAAVPSFDGFWTESLYDAQRFNFERRIQDGKAYDVSLLKKVALFPLSPGRSVIKPMAFNVAVTRPSRDFFDLFGATQTLRIESKPVTIDVLPLPENGKPAEFTGGVGRFTMTASLDRATTTNGEPVSLTVRVSGSGNVKMVDKPQLPTVQGLKILAPEVKDDAQATPDGVRGSRTFRFPLIPQDDGKYEIPPVTIAYFDPADRAYHTLRSGPFAFSASGTAASAPVAEASGLRVLGSDIAYIKADARSLAVTPLDPPWWTAPLYLLSLGMVGGALWFRAHSERLLTDRGYARMTRSSGLARRRLRQAEGMLRKRDEKGLYAALSQAVMGYLGDRFDIDTHAMTKDQLRAALEERRVAPEVASTVISIVDECEVARFSPTLLENHDPRRLFEKTREALGRI